MDDHKMAVLSAQQATVGKQQHARLPLKPSSPTRQTDRASFLHQQATAELLGLSERTLERFRLEGRGPQFRKFGRRVMYATSDVISWADDQRRTSTSDQGDRGPFAAVASGVGGGAK